MTGISFLSAVSTVFKEEHEHNKRKNQSSKR